PGAIRSLLAALMLILLTACSAAPPFAGPQPLSRLQQIEDQESMPELGIFADQSPAPQVLSPPLGAGATFGP
ncbi:MAG: hypothetical protein R6W06_09805, partial [Prochlorococcaceae cyanobacterium]